MDTQKNRLSVPNIVDTRHTLRHWRMRFPQTFPRWDSFLFLLQNYHQLLLEKMPLDLLARMSLALLVQCPVTNTNLPYSIFLSHPLLCERQPSKHAYMGPVWATHMGPIWGVQPGLAWVPYGLAHMPVAQMGPIWVPYNSPIKKKEML